MALALSVTGKAAGQILSPYSHVCTESTAPYPAGCTSTVLAPPEPLFHCKGVFADWEDLGKQHYLRGRCTKERVFLQLEVRVSVPQGQAGSGVLHRQDVHEKL